jgi:hypothetical protein
LKKKRIRKALIKTKLEKKKKRKCHVVGLGEPTSLSGPFCYGPH